ncbi:MAG: excinuclease ABC subunit UvrC [Clostridiales bacterium]|nr:excinuclease ABC subunit UvrC [Clostridiales bacterium]
MTDNKITPNERRAELLEKANSLPLRPGVYIMRDKNDKVIYVGKSRALKNRVSQYFHESAHHNEKTKRMVSNVHHFDYILTDTEIEALSLENSLIKQYTPKYNIRLKDSKSYPYIKITMNDEYPKISVTRKRLADGAKYFGPYSSASAVYSILGTVQKSFGIASCNREFPRDIGKERPCLNKHIGLCSAPCTGETSSEDYRALFKEVTQFLRGSFKECENTLRERMEYASENLMFEAAAKYRDRIEALAKLWQRQKVVGAPDMEEDVIAFYSDEVCSCISVFYIRGGSIVDNEHFLFPAEQIIEEENMTSFLDELYNIREYVPHEILLDFTLPDEELALLTDHISARVGYKPDIRTPERGDRRHLCEMVYDNAKQQALLYKAQTEKDNKTLVKLASMLKLEVVPERIEAYDISNFGSDNITAGMIVAENGKLKKSDYRTFKIKTTDGIDDYGAMREALSRRLAHLTDESFGAAPDLILLDGGKGHVSVIRELMYELGCEIPVFGMVKDDFHKTRALTDDENEISIAREQSVFMFVYKLQEEVHRYTITRMENAKSKSLKHSTLEEIDGIGAIKAKSLLAHFRSIAAIKKADKASLMRVSGITAANADAIIAYYAAKDNKTSKNK